MKTIKSTLIMSLILVVCTSLSQCGNEEVLEEQIAIAPCTNNGYVTLESFENISGTVIKYLRVREDTIVYYINSPEVLKNSDTPIGPCNLPLEVMEEGLKIKFSGNLLTPADRSILLNVEALPFEITKLSLQK